MEDSSSDGPASRAIDDEIARFTDPGTRALLASSGFTMPMLEAALDTTLGVRVLRQDCITAAHLPDTICAALQVAGSDCLVIRRSRLVDRHMRTASINLVIGISGPSAAAGVDDVGVPIGHSLRARGLTQRRHILRVGLTRWPDGRLSATKAYVIMLGDRPLCYIREAFNPSVIVADHHGTDVSEDLHWNDEPSSAQTVGADALTSNAPTRASHPLEPSSGRREWFTTRPRESAPTHSSTPQKDCLSSDLDRAARGDAIVLHLADGSTRTGHNLPARASERDALLHAAAAVLSQCSSRAVVAIAHSSPGPIRARSDKGGPPDSGQLPRAFRRPVVVFDDQHGDPPSTPSPVDILRRVADRCESATRRDLLRHVAGLLALATDIPAGGWELHSSVPQLHLSREYTGLPELPSRPPDSAALLWIGDRTGADGGLRGTLRPGHPTAIALDRQTTPADVVMLCRRWNPENRPGVLTLVPSVALDAGDHLRALFEAGADCGTPVTWLCDPIPTGLRNVDRGLRCRTELAAASIHAFGDACRSTGTSFGGLHLEYAPGSVRDLFGAPRRDRERFCDSAFEHGRGLDPSQLLRCVIAALDDVHVP
ncbi:3-deoxy-7-phosphoheptulonate synthase [Nocardia sp. NBC_01377]|uniref:3-deoxy-7-phosphoheptulonate synthase n=1 Tax=Nocardia sp. NBC_01377 TaxID=2903595 RepID=UPI00386BD42E